MEEQFQRTKRALERYQDSVVDRLSYQQHLLSSATLHHKSALFKADFGEFFEHILNCVELNQTVIQEIISSSLGSFPNSDEYKNPGRIPKLDHQRVEDMLISLAREWSVDGAKERKLIFDPVVEEVEKFIPQEDEGEFQILMPGSGLLRCPFDLAMRLKDRNVRVLTNEANMTLLMAANFILNCCERKDNYRIYPYLSDLKNRFSGHTTLTPVQFPDVDVTQRPEGDAFKFQTLPGDFLALVAELEPESVDMIVTTFFLGTGRNALATIEGIWRVLRVGGHWINLGNLDYPYEMFEAEKSVEIPWDILLKIIVEEFKFQVVNERRIECDNFMYQGPSMEKISLNCPFNTFRKS